MIDQLVHPDGRDVKRQEHIMDAANRPWSYEGCAARGFNNLDYAEVFVRQVLHNGSLAKTQRTFRLDFFPGYKIRPEFPQHIPPHRLVEGYVES